MALLYESYFDNSAAEIFWKKRDLLKKTKSQSFKHSAFPVKLPVYLQCNILIVMAVQYHTDSFQNLQYINTDYGVKTHQSVIKKTLLSPRFSTDFSTMFELFLVSRYFTIYTKQNVSVKRMLTNLKPARY